MQRTATTNQICSECWNRAVYAFGTGQIFLKRSRKYTDLLRALSFVGIIVPLLVGGIVIGFGTKGSYLEYIIGIAVLAGIVQLGFSALSIVYSWADNLQYSLESAAENLDLSVKFSDLGKQAQTPPDDLELRVAVLNAKDDSRHMADAKKNVTPKELRYGHRAGLRQFSRECEECKKIPRSLEASKCNTCGDFK